jgi:hypothetical protein
MSREVRELCAASKPDGTSGSRNPEMLSVFSAVRVENSSPKRDCARKEKREETRIRRAFASVTQITNSDSE